MTAGPMTLVVDASVAVKWFVRENLTEQARTLLVIPDTLSAPDWILVEAASTFWKKVKRGELLAIHAERHLRDLPTFFETLHPAAELIGEAFNFSVRLRHSVYDCVYLALAQREKVELVTADEKFAAKLDEHGLAEQVRLLS